MLLESYVILKLYLVYEYIIYGYLTNGFSLFIAPFPNAPESKDCLPKEWGLADKSYQYQ